MPDAALLPRGWEFVGVNFTGQLERLRLQKICLKSADLPISEQVDFFIKTWAKGYEVKRPFNPDPKTLANNTPTKMVPASPPGFDMDVVICQIGNSIFHGGRFDPFLVNRGGIDIPPENPGLMIVAFIYGDGVVGVGDTARMFRRGDVLIYDRAKPFHFNGAIRHKQVSLVVPYDTLGLEASRHQSLRMFRSGDPMARLIHYHFNEISKAVDADQFSQAQILLAGFKAFFRKAVNLQTTPETRIDAVEEKFKSIKIFIQNRLADPALGVNLLMQEFGLSRASLYRLFAECGGVAAYVRRCRLEMAYGSLSRTRGDRTGVVGTVAEQLCFYDTAHFTKSFKARFGVCPRDVCGIADGMDETAGRVDGEIRSHERPPMALVD